MAGQRLHPIFHELAEAPASVLGSLNAEENRGDAEEGKDEEKCDDNRHQRLAGAGGCHRQRGDQGDIGAGDHEAGRGRDVGGRWRGPDDLLL